MLGQIYTTEPQKNYTGPDDLKIFADFLPYIGEVVITFSRLEKRVTWAIESLQYVVPDEAYALEETVKNFNSRFLFFKFLGKTLSEKTNTQEEFLEICKGITKSNTLRNNLLHNSFTGIQTAYDLAKGTSILSLNKEKFNPRPEKRPYKMGLEDLRKAAIENLKLCMQIQSWVLSVRPEAQNRVP